MAVTEAEVLVMLRARYTEKAGNGDAWAFATHVRNAAGFDASRTADAIAMSLWPSRGLELHGFEIKCSRADWQRELVKPDKAEAFVQLIDCWWLVVSDEKIVHDGELPPTWGLLVARGRKLVCKREAPRLRAATPGRALPPGFGRTFLAALLRSANKAGALKEELAEAREAARAEAKRDSEREIERLEQDRDHLEELIATFERESGVRMRGWYGTEDVAAVSRALRIVLEGEKAAGELEDRLRRIIDQAERVASDARRVIRTEQVAA